MTIRFIADNSTEASDLAALANDPGVTLNVTALDLRRLPAHVKASIYTSAKAFNAPQLQISGEIDADRATSFSAPQLQTSGNISADRATSFDAPQLQTSGNIDARNATSFRAPLLQTSGVIIVPDEASLRASSSQPARPAPGPASPTADRREP